MTDKLVPFGELRKVRRSAVKDLDNVDTYSKHFNLTLAENHILVHRAIVKGLMYAKPTVRYISIPYYDILGTAIKSLMAQNYGIAKKIKWYRVKPKKNRILIKLLEYVHG